MTPNRYRLIRTIASGGMAHVYEAVAQGDAGFERRVALKRILPELAHLEGLKRMFLDEARIASHLHHGNIVQVLDYGSVDDTEFIAMEYVDGVDADRAVSQSRQQGVALPDVLALHIASEVAHALAYAHAREDHDGRPLAIVHRDVSPHNLLLSWDGDVKLADFGIAKAATRLEKTSTGIVKGKLSYMAPEQAKGAAVGPSADIYALGATVHALITGAPPEADEEPPEMSPDIAALIASCMKLDAEDRPTAAEVALEAGRLATQRLDRDARGALATWLAPLRGAGIVSALDDLMGVFLTSSSDGGERRFTVERMAVADTALADGSDRGSALAPPAGVHLPTGTDTEVVLPTNRRGLWVTATVVAAIGVGAAAVLFMPSPRGETVSVSGAEAEAVAEAETEAVAVAEAVAEAEAEAVAVAVVEAQAEVAPAAETKRRGGTVRRAGSDMRTPMRDRVEAAAPIEATAQAAADMTDVREEALSPVTAFLRIPRTTAAQESIEVDGRPHGFTPRMLGLPTGPHRVVIRDAASSEVILDRSIDLAAHHTRVAPLSLPH